MVTPLCAQAIRGNVFGGGQIAQVAGNTTVTIRTGSVEVKDSEGGNVYGGGEAANITVGENGSGTTTVIVDGGTIDKSVYGGGHGNTTNVATSTTVTANGGTIGEDVYGGSGFGKVGATAVTINKRATVTRDVFGGGFGSTSPDYEADVNGNASVTINKGAIINGNVYGGNNTNGSPKGTITVLVDGPVDETEKAATPLNLNSVFGGGKNAATTSSAAPAVTIQGCETVIARVFGGGDAASAPATDVEIWGGHIANAFAGGNGENVAAHIGYLADGTPYTYGTGNTQITIKGGVIDNVFGGSNSAGNIRGDASVNVEKDDAACDVQITNLYGGGNKAPGKAGTINIVCTGNGLIENVFGGANAADINSDISLVITGGRINNVFGGNNNSGSINGTISVIVDWDEACDNNYLKNVYGAGNLAQYSAPAGNDNYPRVVIRNATIEQNVYGGGKGDATRPSENLGQVTGNPQVFVGTASCETDGPNNSTHTVTVKGSIYGGGDAAPVTGNPYVETNGMTNAGVTINNYVFGGGLGATAKITGSTLVKILGNTRIDKNVYGGGFGGDVTGNTHVVIGGED